MFRKSSYSHANGNCVEVDLGWKKSSHCLTALVGVRDTREAEPGAERVILGFSSGAWQEFITGIKR